jgi:uncharacterized protein YjiS (DUF1127 family)
MKTAARRITMIAEIALPVAAGQRAALADALRTLVDRVLIAWERTRQRRALAELDDRLLRDVGLGRAEADRR